MSALMLDADRVAGLQVGPTAITVEARWLMAYAAALGESDPRYYDTTAPGGPLAHALFPVCYEWPLAQALRAKAMDAALARRGVHAFHNLVVHRPPQSGESLRVSARIVAVKRARAGVLVVMRLSSTDRTGVAVTTTDHGSIYRGVELAGEEVLATPPDPGSSPAGGGGVRWTDHVDVPLQMAHVYTECARIYNPIHTDVAVARTAGFPAIILHGTATLALAVSRLVARDLGGHPARVRGVAARFGGMVRLPSELTIRGHAVDEDGIGFDAVGPDGAAVLTDGRVRHASERP